MAILKANNIWKIVVELIVSPEDFEAENVDKDIAHVEIKQPQISFQTDKTMIIFYNDVSWLHLQPEPTL